MTDMKDFKEVNNNKNPSTESDGNIKMDVDLHGKVTNDNNTVNPLISPETQSFASISMEKHNKHEEDIQMEIHDEYCNDDPGLFHDANGDLNSTNLTHDNYVDNQSDAVTQKIEEKEEQEDYEEVNEEEKIIESQDDNLLDEETGRRRLDSKIFENIPLFEVIRPKSLKEFIGQTHLINNHNGTIKNFIRLGYLPSMILHGPPGVGKTSIASILAQETGYIFVEFSATDATVSDLKELLTTIEKENRKRSKKDMHYLRVVVFIDEIHRFTKTQQDFLLPFIELGVFTFIGATTLNPETRIRRAIISRCQIFQLNALESYEIDIVIHKAILYENIRRRVLRNLRSLSYDDECLNLLVRQSNGDTRAAVNLVELVSTHYNIHDLVYELGKHESFVIDFITLKKAIESLKINLSGLQDTKNLGLFLNLYDSMRHIKKSRTIELNAPEKNHDNSNLEINKLATSSPKSVSGTWMLNKMDRENNNTEQVKHLDINRDNSYLDAKNKARAVIYKSERNSLVMKITIPSKLLGMFVKTDKEALNLVDSSDYDEEFRSFHHGALKYNDLEKSYIAQMEVSDDSDVEADPLYFDQEDDIEPIDMGKITLTKYFVLSSIYSLIMLLNRGETPFFIGKQLILFTAIYLKSDNSDMGKTMALLKSFKNSNTDMLTTLSNCVVRLTRAEKLNLSESRSFIQELKYIKSYCYLELQKQNKKNGNHIGALNDDAVEVVYDSKLVEDLLKPADEIPNRTSKPIFEIESLDTFKDVNKELCMQIPQDIGDNDDGSLENLNWTMIDITASSLSESNMGGLEVRDRPPVQINQHDSNSDDSDANETNLSLIKNPETQLE
ncbi:unnamed protein product [Debaryomyces tyrocola]|nr:unnamed protein product [Debaryomyces tyrocola]